DDGRLDRGAGNDRLPDAHAIAFADDHQDLIERHLGANVRRDLFDLELFARRDLVLLAAGFYDRIHVKTPARMALRSAKSLGLYWLLCSSVKTIRCSGDPRHGALRARNLIL